MIDINKKYKTRDGRDVTLYTVTHAGLSPIVGRIDESGVVVTWRPNGRHFSDSIESSLDLIEAKPRIQRTYWVNIYPNTISKGFYTREDADICAYDNRIACIQQTIYCEEGEGL